MIRLRSLSISNFRGIQEGKIDGLTDVNVLVGRNNSGKTTVVEAITRAAMTGGLHLDLLGRLVEQLWQQARSVVSGTGGSGGPLGDVHSLLWYRQDTSKAIELIGTLCDPSKSRKTDEIVYRLSQQGLTSNQIRANNLDPKRKQTFCQGVNVFRPADAFNTDIELRFWAALLSNRRDRLLTQTLNEVFGLDAESFQLLPNRQFMVLFHDYSLPLDLQGDGARAAMRTLMTLAMLKGTLLMLEEPECHQHPGSLERFAAALCRLAKAQEVQLTISTHSAECVRSFLKGAKAADSEAAVFHLTLNDGKQDARRLDPEAVETLTNTGVDVRFLDLYA